jgi:hypothetical protein
MRVGMKPQRIDIVIMTPDCVVKVICHIIAYWTNMEPKRLIFWLTRNSAACFFQDCSDFTPMDPP